MNLLFVGGPARSGTTALAEYLNRHPEVLLCVERYKWVPSTAVVPELFDFGRILEFEEEYEKRNTEERRRTHEGLLARKDPARLKWIGDKNPNYVQTLGVLSENNPGASFILTYRSVEEVVESWQALSRDPEDPWLGGEDGFGLGIENWNTAMRNTRDIIEDGLNLNVLVVGYHDFFYRNDECMPMISRFLDLEFDEPTRASWRESSASFEGARRSKEPLNAEQQSFIEAHADREAEAVVLEQLEKQREEYEQPPPEIARALIRERRRLAIRAARWQGAARARNRTLRERIKEMKARLDS